MHDVKSIQAICVHDDTGGEIGRIQSCVAIRVALVSNSSGFNELHESDQRRLLCRIEGGSLEIPWLSDSKRGDHVSRHEGRRPQEECQRLLHRVDSPSDSSAVDIVLDPLSPSSGIGKKFKLFIKKKIQTRNRIESGSIAWI